MTEVLVYVIGWFKSAINDTICNRMIYSIVITICNIWFILCN